MVRTSGTYGMRGGVVSVVRHRNEYGHNTRGSVTQCDRSPHHRCVCAHELTVGDVRLTWGTGQRRNACNKQMHMHAKTVPTHGYPCDHHARCDGAHTRAHAIRYKVNTHACAQDYKGKTLHYTGRVRCKNGVARTQQWTCKALHAWETLRVWVGR